eukprot:gene11101-3808_t
MSKDNVLFLYGSVTGNAQVICEQIFEEVINLGIKAEINALNEFKKLKFEEYKHVLVVCSTTGNGDAPENAEKFIRFIKKKSNKKDLLKKLKFAVLGLGDTNYDNFCAMGKLINKKFLELGATSFFESGYADDAIGLEQTVEPWKRGVINEISKIKGVKNSSDSKVLINPFLKMEIVENSTSESNNNGNSHNGILKGKLINAEYLTDSKAQKQVLMMEFKVNDVEFQPGDSIGVYCKNDPNLVLFLLKRVKFDPNTFINLKICDDSKSGLFPRHIKLPSTLYNIFMNLDIDATLTHYQLKVLSQYVSNKEELDMITLLLNDEKIYQEEIVNCCMNIIDFLNTFQSCDPPIEHLFHILPAIAPRNYSIANSPLVDKNKIRIAFTVVEKKIKDGIKKGLCTNWLSKLAFEFMKDPTNEIYVSFFIDPTKDFQLPKKLDCTLIFIAAGSGISPVISFLEHLEKLNPKNIDVYLFHGCRRRKIDFIFNEKLIDLYDKKIITNLNFASSQEEIENDEIFKGKFYVQHLIKQKGDEICDAMINKNGHIILCGDGKMSQGVQDSFKEIFQQKMGKTTQEAEEIIKKWKKEKRFQSEIWS